MTDTLINWISGNGNEEILNSLDKMVAKTKLKVKKAMKKASTMQNISIKARRNTLMSDPKVMAIK